MKKMILIAAALFTAQLASANETFMTVEEASQQYDISVADLIAETGVLQHEGLHVTEEAAGEAQVIQANFPGRPGFRGPRGPRGPRGGFGRPGRGIGRIFVRNCRIRGGFPRMTPRGPVCFIPGRGPVGPGFPGRPF